MNRKRRSVLLALLLLTALLTACARHTEKPAEDAPPPQGQDNVPENGAAAEEALWTAAEIRSLFEEKTAGKGYTVLHCAVVDDGAYDRVGVVLYTTAGQDTTYLAFLDAQGYSQTCGIVAPPLDDGALVYQGDGTVAFQIQGSDGAPIDYQVSFSADGTDANFVIVSDDGAS